MDSFSQKKAAAIDKKLERIVEQSAKEAKVNVKKIGDETPDFTRSGNKDQFDHNIAVSEHLGAGLHNLK